MSTLINLIFLLSIAAMLIVYPMYFLELHAFGKIMARDHAGLIGKDRLDLNESYKILQDVKEGRLVDSSLSPDALDTHKRATRLLYIGAALFLIVLFIGLTHAVLAKQVGRA
jgi:hypothetical protein